jgi:colanic acid biosynthesis glycosyl transferase WcaI
MIGAWSLAAFRSKPDVLIIGTDPIFSILVARVWRLVQPKVVIAHWCYDLYPEAAVADGLLREDSFLVKFLRKLLKPAYRSCDLVVDIGSCMRERLRSYDHQATEATLVPWALYEPPSLPEVDENIRLSLFGDSKLGLMYSGNFGRAHSYQEFLELARMLRCESVHFSFGIRGNASQQLKDAITPQDTNISLAGFAPESELQKRLVAPDIHLVSLKPEWTGTVVPSKFFGSLAVGRPVLFAGSKDSSIAIWINEYQVGWVISDHSDLEQVAKELKELSKQPEKLRDIQERCHRVYQDNFSMNATIDRWDELLRGLVERRSGK